MKYVVLYLELLCLLSLAVDGLVDGEIVLALRHVVEVLIQHVVGGGQVVVVRSQLTSVVIKAVCARHEPSSDR